MGSKLFNSKELRKASYVIFVQRYFKRSYEGMKWTYFYWFLRTEVLDFSKLRRTVRFILR